MSRYCLFVDESGDFGDPGPSATPSQEWIVSGILCPAEPAEMERLIEEALRPIALRYGLNSGDPEVWHLTKLRKPKNTTWASKEEEQQDKDECNRQANELASELFVAMLSLPVHMRFLAVINSSRTDVGRPEQTYRMMVTDLLALAEAALPEEERIAHLDMYVAIRTKKGRPMTTHSQLNVVLETLKHSAEVGLAARGLVDLVNHNLPGHAQKFNMELKNYGSGFKGVVVSSAGSTSSMVIQVLHCAHCRSQNVIRHGKDKAGRQRYRCHDCRRTFQGAQEQVGHRARRAEIQARALAAYQERASMRGVCRLFGIGRNTLSGWLKKSASCRRSPRLWLPLAPMTCWNWTNSGRSSRGAGTSGGSGSRSAAAPGRSSRTALADLEGAVGDRGVRTCRLLWERVPRGLRHALTFTDFWEAYQKVVPEGQHVACGKGSGQTNHVERFNNTLRQRLARFVRQTLSFSKSDEMHETCLRLFLHHYNTQMAPSVAASQQHS